MAQGPLFFVTRNMKVEEHELPNTEDGSDLCTVQEPDVETHRWYETEKVIGRLYWRDK